MEQLYVTQEGLDKLKAELQEHRQQTQKVAEAIEHARSFGDLKENAEYHAAKEQQAMLQARIRDLEDKVSRAVLLDDRDVDASKAYVGATVRVLNKKTQKEFEYVLVSPVEADITNGKISVRSPVGQALLGKSVGETVTAEVPAGAMELEVLDISR
ncbi:MAG: transcription elongation factor GreA [Candidatus Hydrogenedentota bacterium]